MDLSNISTKTLEELQASNGDVTKLSTSALEELSRQPRAAAPAATATPSAPPSSNIVIEPENEDLLTSKDITQSELDAIAKRHGADPMSLRNYAIAVGANLADADIAEQGLSYAGSLLSEGLAMGLGRKAFSLAESEGTQKAIDEVRELWKSRRSYGSAAAELAAGLLTPGFGAATAVKAGAGLAKTTGLLAAQGAVMGSAAGLGASEAGEELGGIAVGAVTGGVVGGAMGLISAGVSRMMASRAPAAGKTQTAWQPDETLVSKAAQRAADEKPVTDTQFAVMKDLMARSAQETEELPKGSLQRFFGEVADDPELEDVFADWASRATQKAPGEMDLGQAKREIYQQFESQIVQFADFLSGAEPKNAGKLSPERALKIIAESPQEVLEREWDSFHITQRMTDELGQEIAPRLDRTGAMGPAGMGRWIYASRSVFSMIDNKVRGLNLTGTLDNFSYQNKRYTVALAASQKEARPIADRFARLSPEQKNAVYNALETTQGDDFSAITDDVVRSAAEDYRRLFDNYRTRANEVAGYEMVKQNDAYVPHMAFPQAKGAELITERLLTLKNKGLDLLDTDVDYSTIKAFIDKNPSLADEGGATRKTYDLINEVITSVNYYSGPKDAAESTAKALTKDVNLRAFRIGYGKTIHPTAEMTTEQLAARAAFKRTGAIPELIRQKDLIVLADSWASNTLRAAHLSPALKEMQRARNILLAINADKDAAYVTDVITDISGRREGTMASSIQDFVESSKAGILQKAAKLPRNSRKRRALEALAEWDRIGNAALQQAYPNFLGIHNPRAALQNLTSPILNTIPEVGQVYGMSKLLQVAKGVARRAGTLKKEMQDRGFRGADWSTELQPVVQDALLDSVPQFRTAKHALEKTNEVLMSAFSASETFNIAFAVDMGEAIARDAFGEVGSWANKQALKTVEKLPAGLRQQFKEARAAGDLQECKRIMSEHLVANTVLNYDRANMSEAARWAGPLFSMFTRWPTAIAGDMAEKLATKGAVRGGSQVFAKYFAPLAFLAAINSAMEEDPESEAIRTLLAGETGSLTRYAPAASVVKMAEGKQGAPLIFQPIQAAGTAVSGDFDKAGTILVKFGQGVIPMAGPLAKIINEVMEE